MRPPVEPRPAETMGSGVLERIQQDGWAPLADRWRHRKRRQFWRRLARVMRLGPRAGEPRRRDPLANVSTRLEIEWYAHDVHPWDAALPAARKARVFAEHSLSHTVGAIRRAFDQFPEVDVIDVRVLDPRPPHALLFAGTVSRGDLEQSPPTLAPAMALKLLGVQFRMVDGELLPVR